MLLTELREQLDNPVEFNFSTANYTNNSDQLTYRVTNLPVNGNVVRDAGTVVLDVDPDDFIQQVEAVSEDGVQSIDNVKLGSPLQNFTCGEAHCSQVFDMHSPYTLSVAYTTNSGEQQVTKITFNDSAFEPSEEFNSSRG